MIQIFLPFLYLTFFICVWVAIRSKKDKVLRHIFIYLSLATGSIFLILLNLAPQQEDFSDTYFKNLGWAVLLSLIVGLILIILKLCKKNKAG